MRSKILIIEDNLLLAESMREMLGLLDYEVVGVADSVRDALRLAETTWPDLAIVDVHLAGVRDGIEGAALLRKRFGTQVIFATAEADETTTARALAVDPVAFLVKPIVTQQLVQTIQGAIASS